MIRRVAYICSFPKCGRTWVQHVLAHVINDTEQRGIDVNIRSMNQIILPLHGQQEPPSDNGIYLSHEKWHPGFAKHNVILLLRCPLDTLVSYYHHLNSHMPYYWGQGGLEQSIDEAVPILAERLFHYYESWMPWVADNNVLVVRYEDLIVDVSLFVSLLRHVGVSCSPEDALRAVEASTADKMRAEEIKFGLGPKIDRPAPNTNQMRVRVAKPGSWKKELSTRPTLPRFALLEKYGYVR